jgi:hypothetical protein
MPLRKLGLYAMIDDELLRYYLGRIREIADLHESDALEATDDLLMEFYEGSWTIESARAELDRIRLEADGTLEIIRREVPLDPWRVRELRRSADALGVRWPQALKDQFAGDVNEVRHLAYAATDQAEMQEDLRIIANCSVEPLINAQQVLRVLRDLIEVDSRLRAQNRLTPKIELDLRRANGRAAWYRARRKLEEAEVAAAGGNERKAAKLRAEGTVLLRQDWRQVFPGEEPPPVESFPR